MSVVLGLEHTHPPRLVAPVLPGMILRSSASPSKAAKMAVVAVVAVVVEGRAVSVMVTLNGIQ